VAHFRFKPAHGRSAFSALGGAATLVGNASPWSRRGTFALYVLAGKLKDTWPALLKSVNAEA
jgi:hypothetical protein